MAKVKLGSVTINAPDNLYKTIKKDLQKIHQSKMAEATITFAIDRFCVRALKEAIEIYDESNDKKFNLTGNTRTSFCAGIYYDGGFEATMVGYRVANIDGPSYHFAKVGDKGFTDYGNGEYIAKAVKQYKDKKYEFKHTEDPGYSEGSGYRMTQKYLEETTPRCKTGYAVIIASVTPYVNFLHEARGFEILDEASREERVIANMKEALKNAMKGNF